MTETTTTKTPKTYRAYRVGLNAMRYKNMVYTHDWIHPGGILHGEMWGAPRTVSQTYRDKAPGFYPVDGFRLEVFHDLATAAPTIGGEMVNGVHQARPNAPYQSIRLDAVFTGTGDADIHDFANWKIVPRNMGDVLLMSVYKTEHARFANEAAQHASVADDLRNAVDSLHWLIADLSADPPRDITVADRVSKLRTSVGKSQTRAMSLKHYHDLAHAFAHHPVFAYGQDEFHDGRIASVVDFTLAEINSRKFTPDKTARVVGSFCNRLTADNAVFVGQFSKYGVLTRNTSESRFIDEDTDAFASELPGAVKYKTARFANYDSVYYRDRKTVSIKKLVDEVVAANPAPQSGQSGT